MIDVWGEDIEGEKNWTDTAYINMKKAEVKDSEPAFVHPVEQEDRVKPEKMKTGREPETSFDYVMPNQTFDQHRKHPEKASLHSGKTKTASKEEVEQAEEGFVFVSLSEADKNKKKRRHHRRHHHHHHHHSSSSGSSSESKSAQSGEAADGSGSGQSSGKKHHHHHHHHRRMRRWVKILLIVLGALLGVLLACAVTLQIMWGIGHDRVLDHGEFTIVSPTVKDSQEEIVTVKDDGRTIVYEGKTYAFNEDVACVAFIGVNYNYEERTMHSMGDAIDLIALDTSTGKLSVIGVSRDTIADVNVYSDEGSSIGIDKRQLAYAYFYGDVAKSTNGGANTASALSRLFYGLPVKYYFALNLDALMALNDAIGGVTLTSSMDFTSLENGEISAGDTVTLHGKEVEQYVRFREQDVNGNTGRMKRQQEYISAFLEQIIPAIKKDLPSLSLVSNLYDIVRANSESNLELPEIIYLASELANKLKSTSEIDYIILEGTAKEGEEYTEFWVDEKNVMETMLKVFYRPVD